MTAPTVGPRSSSSPSRPLLNGLAAIEHGLSEGCVQITMNTKIRLITGIAFGFKSPDALIAFAMLSLGGHKPVLRRQWASAFYPSATASTT